MLSTQAIRITSKDWERTVLLVGQDVVTLWILNAFWPFGLTFSYFMNNVLMIGTVNNVFIIWILNVQYTITTSYKPLFLFDITIAVILPILPQVARILVIFWCRWPGFK